MNIRSFKTPVMTVGIGLLLMGGVHTTVSAETTCRADVVFLMDNTGSMAPIIKSTQKAARSMLTKISKGGDPRFKDIKVQFGVATYWGDPNEYVRGGGLHSAFDTYWWCGPTPSYPTRGTTGYARTYHDKGWYDTYRCDYGTPRDSSDDSKSKCRMYYGPESCSVPGTDAVYVADTQNHRIQKFDLNGKFELAWGTKGVGDGQFRYPQGVAVDSSGNVYVADRDNHRVQRFTADGKFAGKIGRRGGSGKSRFLYPQDIAVDSSDNIYVADKGRGYRTGGNRIQKFDSFGKYLLEWGGYSGCQSATAGTSGKGPLGLPICTAADNGKFLWPRGIAIDGSDNVYVVESGGYQVQKFNSSGTFLLKWGKFGKCSGSISPGASDGTWSAPSGGCSGTVRQGRFDNPRGIATDSDGNVYVADGNGHRVQKFNSSGTFLLQWGRSFGRFPKRYDDDHAMSMPHAISVTAADEVFVADSGTHRVLKFDTSGNLLGKWGDEKYKSCDPYCPKSRAGGKFNWPEGIAAMGSSSDDAIKEITGKAYKVNQQLTTDIDKVTRAMSEWAACSSPGGCGADWPEANLFALHQLATEGGKTDSKGYYDPTTETTGGDTDEGYFSCGKSGRIQDPDWLKEKGAGAGAAPYVDPWSLDPEKRKRACAQSVGWRDDAARVVVWFGDAPSHNTTVTREEAINALNERNIVVSGMNTGRMNRLMDSCHNLRSGGFRYGVDDCGQKGYSKIGDPTAVKEATKGTITHEVKGETIVLNAILSGVAAATAQAGSQGMVAFSSREFSPDVKMYKTKFIEEAHSGDLIAKSLDMEGEEAAEVWSAAEIMTTKGKKKNAYSSYQIYSEGESTGHGSFRLDWASCQKHSACNLDLSTNPKGSTDGAGQDRLNWLLGDRSKEGSTLRAREATKGLMGDVWHSSPVYVGPSTSPWWDGMAHVKKGLSFKKFQEKTKDRTPVVYVGSNGGPLHAFDADTGSELFAYYPRSLFSADTNRGYHYLSEKDYNGHVYVDGSPTVSDVVIGKQWQSVLVGTLAKGGRGIFALNVTDPARFTAGGAKFEPYLWEFTNRDDAHFGYSQGKATIALANNGEWVVLIGNGPESTATGKGAGTSQLFILNISGPGPDGVWDLGKDYRRITTHKGEATNRNGGFSVEAVDLNGDGTVDRAYMGDLYSHLWAFDLSSSKPKRWKPAYGDKPLFSGRTEEEDSHTKPITVRPLVTMPPPGVTKWFSDALGAPESPASGGKLKLAKTGDGEEATVRGATGVSSIEGKLGGNGLMIYFGTGRLIDTEDRTLKYKQSYYGVHDRGIPDLRVKHLVQQRFLKDGDDCEVGREDSTKTITCRVTDPDLSFPSGADGIDYSKKSGWYIPLPEQGERVIHRSLVRDGMILFTTVVPTQSVCETGGHGWEMTVMMDNGGSRERATYDADRDGIYDASDDRVWLDKKAKKGVGSAGIKLTAGLPAGSVMFHDRRYTPTSGDDTDKAAGGGTSIKYDKAGKGCVPPEKKRLEPTEPVCGRLSWMELQPRGN